MPTARVFLGAGTVDTRPSMRSAVWRKGWVPNILPTVEALTLKSRNIAASDKMRTVWGAMKRQD